ncbi:MAG: DUF167 domain-containing protein [Chloroflexi bacterium]|nr:DUF167 domain-containing protein [Chloroflexota bacterium]
MAEARLPVHVYPAAPRSEITGFRGGVLEIRVAAPPVKGKANRELVACLSRALGVSKGSVSLLKGAAARNKLIAIQGLDLAEVFRRLGVSPSAGGTRECPGG